MTDTKPAIGGVQLEPATSDFIAGTTAIAVATRDAQFMPTIGKGLGCSVSADRRSVTVFIDRELSAQVAVDLAAGSPLAAVFSYPATHQTVQIKGARAAMAPASAAQRVRARTQIDAIVEHLVTLGYEEARLRVFFNFTPAALLAVTFAPAAVFAQTPGPRAGERIAG